MSEPELERLEVFVPGRPSNPLNGSWGGWRKHARLAQTWRDRTVRAVWATCTARRVRVREPAAPKRITFAVLTWNPWDDDALPPACKPVRDGLVDARVIHGDAPADGHEFVYGQRVSRARRGVEILIERRTGVGARA